MLFIICATLLLRLVSGSADEEIDDFYYRVKGKCNELKPIANFNEPKFLKDSWRPVLASYEDEGITCYELNMTDKGDNKVNVIINGHNSKTGENFVIHNQVENLGNGVFKGTNNTVDLVMATDYSNYHVYIQCKTYDDGTHGILLTFATRNGQVDSTAQAKFDEATVKLKDMQLYPDSMHKVNQENCPSY